MRIKGENVIGSKFDQMVNILINAIDSGEYKEGDRLDSENILSAKYNISRNTVREALSVLVQQGYVSRTQGKGTFVTKRPVPPSTGDTYAIFIHAHDHVYETESRALVRTFQRGGALPMVFDMRELKGAEQIEKIILKLLERGVAGMVVEDVFASTVADVCRRVGRQMPYLATVNSIVAENVKAVRVATDFQSGTRLGTQHLLDHGCRRILFVIHRNPHMAHGMSPDTVEGIYGDIARGYTSALAGSDQAVRPQFFLVDHEFAWDSDDRDRLKQILAGAERPDAVFAFGDHRAKHVIDIADEAGMRVPDDLSVIGYWNTPWAEMTRVPLTSVSIREEEIARIAAEKLMAAHGTGKLVNETIVIAPELIIRSSCGRRHEPAGKKG